MADAAAATRPRLTNDSSQSQGIASGPGGPAPYDDQRPIWIYVDDSNIWITAKKLAAKKMKTKEDHRVRIDVGRLTDVVAKGREVAQGFLYGSEPPPVDTVWEKIKQRGWDVEPKRRSTITGKEKGVDAQLVADITEIACTTPEEERTTIIIISGDADAMPAIHKVLKYRGWNVEIYMWEDAMSNELKKLPRKEPKVVVEYLDEFLERITFTNMKFDPRNLHSFDKSTAVVFQMEPDAFRNRVPTVKWCRRLESITQWPFQYYWAELDGKGTNDLVLVFRKDYGRNSEAASGHSSTSNTGTGVPFDVTSFLTQIDEYPIEYTVSAQSYVQYEQEKSGLYKMALEMVGHILYSEARVGYSDTAISSVSDDDDNKSWNVKRRQQHPRKSQRYSELCEYKFNCKYGLKCHNKHTDDEKSFFKKNQGQGNPLRKAKPCSYYPNCKKDPKECHYAHGEEDAWCLNCRDMCGHYTNNCPQLKKSQDAE